MERPAERGSTGRGIGSKTLQYSKCSARPNAACEVIGVSGLGQIQAARTAQGNRGQIAELIKAPHEQRSAPDG